MITNYFYEDLEPGIEIQLTTDLVSPGSTETYRNLIGSSRLQEGSESTVSISLLISLTVEKHLQLDVLKDSFVEVSGHEFTFIRPAVANEILTAFVFVTHRMLFDDASRGSVGFRMSVVSSVRGEMLEGSLSLVVLTRSSKAAREMEESRPSFASPGWLAVLTDLLSNNEHFAQATSPFDGTIAVDFGAGAIGLRIYRGRIIDAGRSFISGATFTVSAPPWTWLQLASRPRNEFIKFAMRDAFLIRGSTYEYLRMTRALIVLTDQVRSLFCEDVSE